MSRKDFEQIAHVIHLSYASGPFTAGGQVTMTIRDWNGALDTLARRMADVLASTNPLFDRARFIRAATGLDS